MLRAGLIAALMLGLGSTAMASDRVRVFVTYDSGYHTIGHGYYADSFRYYWRTGSRWDDWRWNNRHRLDWRWDNRRGYGWRDGRHYSAPRGYNYSLGYSRGYFGAHSHRYHDSRHHGGRH
jgi:hypothetical protein